MDAQTQISAFEDYLESNQKEELLQAFARAEPRLVLDFKKIARHNPELAERLLDEPEETLKAAELAFEHFDIPKSLKHFRARLDNVPDSCELSVGDIRSANLGVLSRIKGMIRQKTKVVPKATSIKYECPSCGTIINMLQLSDKLQEPTRCTCGRKGKFKLVSKELVDAQAIVLEEETETLEGGRQPQRINIILQEDLVSPVMDAKTCPGSRVEVVGVVKEVPIILRSGGQSTKYDYAFDCIFVKPTEEDKFVQSITEKDEKSILDFSKRGDLFEELRRYIGPSLFGYEEVKEALLLQMVGGAKKKMDDGTTRRGDVHILICGDPGEGKTVLGQSILPLVNKSRFIGGKSTSGAGVTAGVVKNEITGGYALEAGAMVLAHKSILVIDEMDKMSEEDISNLHTGMEQGIIPITKIIQATLKAETSILGIANPEFGRFDPYKPLHKQIKVSPPLLSRFDYIYAIRDVSTEEDDEKAAKFILGLHKNRKTPESFSEEDYRFFRKYIFCAKRIDPRLSDESEKVIREYWINLRVVVKDEESGTVSVTKRQLEALVRATEASAKLRLSKVTNEEDAFRATRMSQYCLKQIGTDPETGRIDMDRITTDFSSSGRKRARGVKDVLVGLQEEMGEVPISDLMRDCKELGIDEGEVEEVLEVLKKSGDIFFPRPDVVRTI